MKKGLYSVAFIIIVIAVIAVFTMPANHDVTLTLDDKEISIQQNELVVWELLDDLTYEAYGYTFSNGQKEVVDKIQARDFIHTMDVLKDEQIIGQLNVTLRQIDNNDVFVFSKFTNTSDVAYTIPLKLTFKQQAQHELFGFQQDIPQEHDRVIGIDYTTNIKGIYSFTNSPVELVVSQNYISRELTESYENGTQSRVRELVSEDLYIEDVSNSNDLVLQLKLRTTAGQQISESWLMLAQNSLFHSEAEQAFYKDYTNHYFAKSQKWLVHGGNYSKLPWSIEPNTTLGYGRNLVRLKDNTLTERYQQTKDRYYYNLIVDNVNNLIDFKGEESLWLTEYTSAWLKREYGISAPYTDTRHNENIALFLSEAGDILHNATLKNSYLNYADFLTEQQVIGNILPTANGYYVLDYYAPTQTKKTHVSLNHALSEMNFLFEAYTLSKDTRYLETAKAIKAAVEDMGTQWINPNNGDFWYQINGDYSFQDKDYDTLTLEDLIKSLAHFTHFDLPVPALYDTLVTSKLQFIKQQQTAISKLFYDALMETKYAPLIENYPNIILAEQ